MRIWMHNVPGAISSISLSSGVNIQPTAPVVISIGLHRTGLFLHIKRARDQSLE